MTTQDAHSKGFTRGGSTPLDDDNIEVDWHDMKEEGGVKYMECEWMTPDPSPAPGPAPSPRAMQQLAAALQAALEKKVIIDTPPPPPSSTDSPATPPLTVVPVRLVKRRVHGAL